MKNRYATILYSFRQISVDIGRRKKKNEKNEKKKEKSKGKKNKTS